MARIPVRFERVAAAFDTAARGVGRPCQSSGSEHSPESSTDLSDLVKSFMERDDGDEIISEELLLLDDDRDVDSLIGNKNNNDQKGYGSDNEAFGGYNCSDLEKKDLLMKLLSLGHNNDDDDDKKRKILDQVQVAYDDNIGDVGSSGFKRRLMSYLRDKGFDAGLCKSKWEKSKRFPSGDYEFIDVNIEGSRYIVETNLVGEFEIARPSDQYTSLLEIFPQIFVGKVGELKQIVRLMCSGIRQSMKAKDMPIPPWRRSGYMQAKWFGSYKRTTKSTPSKNKPSNNNDNHHNNIRAFESKKLIGFEFERLPTVMPFFCRSDFPTKVGLRVSNLTAAFNC